MAVPSHPHLHRFVFAVADRGESSSTAYKGIASKLAGRATQQERADWIHI